MSIKRVGIVGGGQMGGGNAEVCARAGVDVVVIELDDELVERARTGVTRSLDKAIDRGKLDVAGRSEAMST